MFGRVYAWFAALYQLTSAPLGSEVSLKDGVAVAPRDHSAMSIYSVAGDDAFEGDTENSRPPTPQSTPLSNTIAKADRFMLAARLQSIALLNRPTLRAKTRYFADANTQTAKYTPNRVVWREHRIPRRIASPVPLAENRAPILMLVKSDIEPSIIDRQRAA